ncbi:TPA: hypothetical protein ACH3X1_010322 [Trebouxia sp. C0004]
MSSNQQIKRITPAKLHWQKLLPQLKGGKLSRPLKMTHDCLWFRPAYPWVGVVVSPEVVVDYYCNVFYWNPMVQFFGFPGMPFSNQMPRLWPEPWCGGQWHGRHP